MVRERMEGEGTGQACVYEREGGSDENKGGSRIAHYERKKRKEKRGRISEGKGKRRKPNERKKKRLRKRKHKIRTIKRNKHIKETKQKIYI